MALIEIVADYADEQSLRPILANRVAGPGQILAQRRAGGCKTVHSQAARKLIGEASLQSFPIRKHRRFNHRIANHSEQRRLVDLLIILVVDETCVVHTAAISQHHVPVAGENEVAVGGEMKYRALRRHLDRAHSRSNW